MSRKVIIGSRGSDLALWQAHHTIDRLNKLGIETELKIIKTQGDKIQHLSFDKMEGKGFFTKEIEESLLNKSIDLAVHSHKDLETTNPSGLKVAAVSDREDPSELLLINPDKYDESEEFNLAKGALVGTSSGRRKTQLKSLRPDLKIDDLRGNVPTRINKLREGNYDAIMLAKAGVARLNLDVSDLKVVTLDPKVFIPAPAQGVLGWQIREDDKELADIIANLNNNEVQERISIERKVLNLFQGGCQLPLGSYCEKEDGTYKLWALMSEDWEDMPRRVYLESDQIEGMAQKAVEQLGKKKA